MPSPPKRSGRAGGDGGGGGSDKKFRPISVLQGVGFAFATSLAAALVVGLLVAWTPAWYASDAVLATLNVLAVAAGGVYAGRKARRLGWLHGAAAGLIYILLATWMVTPQFSWGTLATASWLQDALLACAAGAVGGIVGVAT